MEERKETCVMVICSDLRRSLLNHIKTDDDTPHTDDRNPTVYEIHRKLPTYIVIALTVSLVQVAIGASYCSPGAIWVQGW